MVSPEGVRAAAAKVDAIVEGVDSSPRFAITAEAGHARLAASVASFAAAVGQRWQARRRSTVGIAANLRRTAVMYEAADDDAAGTVRTGSGEDF